MSRKQYKDPEALRVNTLENAIYMAIKNDLSFVIDSRLSLYEAVEEVPAVVEKWLMEKS